MPYKPHEPKKVYWNISEASEIVGVTTPVLRLWDDLYAAYIGEVKRMGTRDQRHYTEDQIEKLKNINYLLHGDKIEILMKLEKFDQLEREINNGFDKIEKGMYL